MPWILETVIDMTQWLYIFIYVDLNKVMLSVKFNMESQSSMANTSIKSSWCVLLLLHIDIITKYQITLSREPLIIWKLSNATSCFLSKTGFLQLFLYAGYLLEYYLFLLESKTILLAFTGFRIHPICSLSLWMILLTVTALEVFNVYWALPSHSLCIPKFPKASLFTPYLPQNLKRYKLC